MDKAKAADVAAAVVNAGFFPIVTLLGSGQYTVGADALAADKPITIDAAKQFEDGLGVSGTVPHIDFI